jgi:hypothetical protein
MSTSTPILHVDMDAFFAAVEQMRRRGVGFWNPTPFRGLYKYGSHTHFFRPPRKFTGQASNSDAVLLRFRPKPANPPKKSVPVAFTRALLELLLLFESTYRKFENCKDLTHYPKWSIELARSGLHAMQSAYQCLLGYMSSWHKIIPLGPLSSPNCETVWSSILRKLEARPWRRISICIHGVVTQTSGHHGDDAPS